MIYKFKILDKHETQSFDDEGNLNIKPFGEWLTFNVCLNLKEVTIVSFRSYILFDEDNTPKEVTKVYLSDGSFVFASNKYDTFEKNFIDNYLPLFNS